MVIIFLLSASSCPQYRGETNLNRNRPSTEDIANDNECISNLVVRNIPIEMSACWEDGVLGYFSALVAVVERDVVN